MAETHTRATTWLKPEQVEQLRSVTVATAPEYLATRNDALLALLYDTGLRVGECVALDLEHLELDDAQLGLPAELQKDYPTDRSPSYTRLGLAEDTVRTLRTYLATRWSDPTAVWPSREADRMSTESVRRVVATAAEAADIRPYTLRGRGDPDAITPHTLRHSVAYRMLDREGATLYDVTNRLRHATIQTTERVYAHFDVV